MEEHVDMLMGVILPYVNFFMFLAMAIYFFRKPAREAATKKRDAYERILNESKAARDDALARLEELKKRQTGLDSEIAEIKSASKASADLDAAKIVSDAESLAKHLREEARRVADAEVSKARATLREEIVAAVRQSVTEKLKSELSGETQLSLVKSRIGELKTIRAEG